MVVSLPLSVRAQLGTLLDAWIDGYGREAHDLPSACERWATQVMIADLEPRYIARPETLEPLRRRLAELQASAG